MNVVTLSGKFANPKFKTTTSGTLMATFGVGDQMYKEGERKTQWINCVAFGKRAETIQKFSEALDKIAVNGKLNINQWENDKGKQTTYNILVDDFDLTFKNKTDTTTQTTNKTTTQDFASDEIPF
tara:strand:+ start:8057 stop:8431 length:375 start_codon:yes stop_codon:yes gene_type:complete